jgi:acetoacetyl-CoA synthetase
MQQGQTLTDQIKNTVRSTIRSDYSPRHVPDEIIQVDDIPYTISGKKTETPVKKVLMGKRPEDFINSGALRNPESIAVFKKWVG